MQRLDKILSEAGVASRKELKAMIKAGRVSVGGVVATAAEQKVDVQASDIRVDGAPVHTARTVVVMLNKPAGYVTSTDDPREKTVMELLPPALRALGLAPVGRLDKDTEGLLLFTNDGKLAHQLISPKKQIDKVYLARHAGEASPEDVHAFAQGLLLRDGTICLPALLEPLEAGRSRVTVHEGKYHQVRRMMASRGLHVAALQRVQEGGLSLDDLAIGQCRELCGADMERLLN